MEEMFCYLIVSNCITSSNNILTFVFKINSITFQSKNINEFIYILVTKKYLFIQNEFRDAYSEIQILTSEAHLEFEWTKWTTLIDPNGPTRFTILGVQ